MGGHAKTLTNARTKPISAVNMHFAATLMAHTIALALMDIKEMAGYAQMSTSARKESTTAVGMPTAEIELVLITVHATLVLKETGGPVRMWMNARRQPTIAVSMPSVQIRSGHITALAIVDFKQTAHGYAKMWMSAREKSTTAVSMPIVLTVLVDSVARVARNLKAMGGGALMLTSAREAPTAVTPTQPAITLKARIVALATQDTEEMEKLALVSARKGICFKNKYSSAKGKRNQRALIATFIQL